MTGYSPEFIDLQEVRQRDGESTSVNQSNEFLHFPGSEVEHQLHQRIRELESLVTSQNIELADKEALKRDYNVVVERLNKVTTEKDAFADDREKLYKDKTFYEEQAGGYFKKIEIDREKMNDSYRRIVEIRNSKEETEEKVRRLEQEVLFWRGKYEHERKDKDNDQSKSSNTKISNGRPKSEQIRENKSDTSPHPKRRRRTFCQSLTVLPKCKNCLTVFDLRKPHEIQCSFHRSPPQPWKTWKKQVGSDGRFSDLDRTNTEGYMYWPCCEHVGLKEPPGCLKLKSHDLIYPEVQN